MKKEKTEKKEKVPMDKAKKKKIIRRSILGVIVLVVVFFIGSSVIAAKNAKPIVYTQAATTGDVEQVINTSGNIKTENTKIYFADVALPIGKINVQPGDAVAKGDALLNYKEDALENEKKLAELKLQSISGSYNNSMQTNSEKVVDLTEANTNIPVLDQQIADTEEVIRKIEDKISKKQSALAYEGTLLQISLQEWSDQPFSEEYENLQKLIQYNSYEQQHNKDIKAWQDELASANDTLAHFKEYRSEMKSQKSSSEAGKMTSGSKTELEANNQTQKIQADQTLVDLAAAENGVTAEFAGVVTSVDVVEGATTVAGGKLLTLESTEDVKVEISISKYDLDKIKEGQNVDVTVAGNTYQGVVSKISKMAVNNSTGTPVVATDIKITNPDESIFLGVEAKVVIHTAEAKGVVLVPVEAVNTDKEGDFVYTVENNILMKNRVVTGISSDSFIEIKEGLQDGMIILTELTSDIPEGTEVMALPANSMPGAAQSADGTMSVTVG